MATQLNHEYLNNLFIHQIDSDAGRTKLAEAGKEYLKLRLRERSFARHILPPVKVTKADCQRAVDHEGLVKIIDIEPESKAMAINFRSEPDGRYITGSRYQVKFFTIASERFTKTETELMSWEAPITKIIEDNVVKDIEYVEDSFFMKYVRAAIAAGDTYYGATYGDGTGRTKEINTAPSLEGLVDGFNMLEKADTVEASAGHVRPCQLMLMSQPTYNRYLTLDGNKLGLELRSEVTKDGYTYDKMLGKRLIVTMKSDLVLPGEVFFFTAQEYLGHWFILNDTRFYLNKDFNLVEMQGMEEIAMGIASVTGIAYIKFLQV
jgi:hypothetical protein